MAWEPIPSANPRDIIAINLDRVLVRLERKILSQDVDPRLQHSSYERIKTTGVRAPPPTIFAIYHGLADKTNKNLEYARTLLLRLEHDSSTIKIQSRKAAAQTSLSSQRALIKRLTERLHELDQTGDDDDLLNGPEDEEDILAGGIPASKPVPSDPIPKSTLDRRKTLQDMPSEPANILRNRHAPTKPPDAISSLPPNPSSPTGTTNTSLIENQDSESALLTERLVSLARALKDSSTQFSTSLNDDTETLNRTVEGLDKNTTGMDAAGRRMGLLKRMSEGKGWWGRMMLYAWIAGLWVVVILLVFVGPKLRF